MNQETSQSRKLLNTIKQIIANSENKWFADELRKSLGGSSVSFFSVGGGIENDIHVIREALSIRANPSIDYRFVKSELVRKQLIVDNLRMENAALDLDIKNESDRFYNFCVNAFYQVENLVNYYYGTLYPDKTICVQHIQDSLNKSEFPKNLKENEKRYGIGSIVIANKLTAIGVDLGLEGAISVSLYYLKELRNSGSHRCSILLEQNKKDQVTDDKDLKLLKFVKYQTFATIRTTIQNFALTLQKALSPQYYRAKITQKLPSAVFVNIEGKVDCSLPQNLLDQVKDKSVDSEIIVGISTENGKGKIVSVRSE